VTLNGKGFNGPTPQEWQDLCIFFMFLD